MLSTLKIGIIFKTKHIKILSYLNSKTHTYPYFLLFKIIIKI